MSAGDEVRQNQDEIQSQDHTPREVLVDSNQSVSSIQSVPSVPSSPSNSSSNMEHYAFKLLCPQIITGLIIGRNGAFINQLNVSSGARIRLSQNNEFFPGTNDRILVLTGSKEGVANAVRELVTRIVEAPEKKSPTGAPPLDMYGHPISPPNRGPLGTFQIKVLVPKIASAALIGKGGCVMRKMSDISGAKYQMGDDFDPYNIKERIVVINAADSSSVVSGSLALMYQLFEESKVRNYPILTTNYGILAPMPQQFAAPTSPMMGMMGPGMGPGMPMMQAMYQPMNMNMNVNMNGPGLAYPMQMSPSYMGSYIPNPPPPIQIPMMAQHASSPGGRVSPPMVTSPYSNMVPQHFPMAHSNSPPTSFYGSYPVTMQQDSFGNVMYPMHPQPPMYGPPANN